ncbi:MAG TPA: Smr/MutS family protein [Chitinophagales bacterium]|nr:Smr/MutS family protein [Chitinophagales bacterium]
MEKKQGGKFKVGNKVWLEHTGEEATITKIDPTGLLYVNAGGHVIPVFMSQVSKHLPESIKPLKEIAAAEKKKEEVPTIAIDKTKIKKRKISLVFIPQRLKDGEIVRYELGLLNETKDATLALVIVVKNNGEEKVVEKRLGDESYLKLDAFAAEVLNDIHSVLIRFEPDDRMLDVFQTEQKIKAASFIRKNALVEPLGTEAFVYELLEQFSKAPVKVDIYKDIFKEPNKKKPHAASLPPTKAEPPTEVKTENGISDWRLDHLRQLMLDKPMQKETVPIRQVKEVDLHIENILPSHDGMLPMDILLTQIEHFRKALDHAIVSGQKVFYVVHGFGTGKLKKEIEKILVQHPEVASFNNSFHPRYGHGATEVHLKQ